MKEKNIPGDVVSKLYAILVIAVGNILVVVGQALIHYGEDKSKCIDSEEETIDLIESSSNHKEG